MAWEYIVTIFLLFLKASGWNLPDDIECGKPFIQPDSVGRHIVGGKEVVRGSWPWMVLLKKGGKATCGGSILSQQFVLTAAHCFDGETDLSKWKVYVGKHDKILTDPTEVEHTILQVLPHGEFNNKTLLNDIALLEVREHINFTKYARPICLSRSQKTMQFRRICYTTGWGETLGTGYDNVLKQVNLQKDNPYLCQALLRRLFKTSLKGKFCAGKLNKDACVGDSGGPYSCKIKGIWYINGVVSYGAYCGQPKWPGIYVNVPNYVKWIEDKMSLKTKS